MAWALTRNGSHLFLLDQYGPPTHLDVTDFPSERPPALIGRIDRWGWRRVTAFYTAGDIVISNDRLRIMTSAGIDHIAILDRAGWPCLSMNGRLTRRGWFDGGSIDDAGCALLLSRTHTNVRMLPLRPLWPAFLIDTLFYAAIWFGIFFGFARARQAIRRRRGRCPKCGYDVRGEFESGCSECGWNRSEPRP